MDNERNEIEMMLSQTEVAKIFKVSVKTLEYWRCRGEGPRYIKIGKLVRYQLADLKEYMRGSVEWEKRKREMQHEDRV